MDPTIMMNKSSMGVNSGKSIEKVTNKMRKMTLQNESIGMQHAIQMPKTPYIR
jgi:hypothetical protein